MIDLLCTKGKYQYEFNGDDDDCEEEDKEGDMNLAALEQVLDKTQTLRNYVRPFNPTIR